MWRLLCDMWQARLLYETTYGYYLLLDLKFLDPILIEMHFSCLMYCMKCGCCCFRTILSDSQICQKMEQFMNWRATWVSLKTIVLYIAPFTVLHQSEIPNKIRLSLCSENPKTRWCHAVDTMSNFWIHCTYTNIYNF